ncbi:DUF5324 family protein [Kitasatospora sp. NPDC088351]|uniref:DUF5324 family protein n=1 Tax=unclassified Kitasatospora TaxID=2633591 RepID=UPI0034478D6B
MTRLDSARETAGKTRDALVPYAATAKDTAAQLADDAKQRLGPALDALGPKAAQAAHSVRVQYDRHVAPQFGHAFASLPPEAQQHALKALHRTQEAALAARLSAARAADQARSNVGPKVVQVVEEARAAVTPVAQEAQTRGAAALTALQGNVTSAEISHLAARNLRKKQCNAWATGLAVAGAVAIGSGIVIWQWWRHRSNPEWLVEPPAGQSATTSGEGGPAATAPHTGAHAVGGGAPAGSPVDESDPETGSEAATDATRPGPPPGEEDDHPKPHDPRKPH